MIKCKDCKYSKSIKNESGRLRCSNEKFCYNTAPNDGLGYWDEESYSASFDVGPDFGCIHAKRADGIKECCPTCKHHLSYGHKTTKCEKHLIYIESCEGKDATLELIKFVCDEWEAKA